MVRYINEILVTVFLKHKTKFWGLKYNNSNWKKKWLRDYSKSSPKWNIYTEITPPKPRRSLWKLAWEECNSQRRWMRTSKLFPGHMALHVGTDSLCGTLWLPMYLIVSRRCCFLRLFNHLWLLESHCYLRHLGDIIYPGLIVEYPPPPKI